MSGWWRRGWRVIWEREAVVFGRWEMALMRFLFALVMFDAGSKLVEWARADAGSFNARWGQVEVIPQVSSFVAQPKPHGLAVV